jgi:hypothetical protein
MVLVEHVEGIGHDRARDQLMGGVEGSRGEMRGDEER